MNQTRITLRLDEDLHKYYSDVAKLPENKSLNRVINIVLRKQMEK